MCERERTGVVICLFVGHEQPSIGAHCAGTQHARRSPIVVSGRDTPSVHRFRLGFEPSPLMAPFLINSTGFGG
jgi:hypothetical protein